MNEWVLKVVKFIKNLQMCEMNMVYDAVMRVCVGHLRLISVRFGLELSALCECVGVSVDGVLVGVPSVLVANAKVESVVEVKVKKARAAKGKKVSDAVVDSNADAKVPVTVVDAGAVVEVNVKKARVVKGKKVPVTVVESNADANVDVEANAGANAGAVVEVKKARVVKGKKVPVTVVESVVDVKVPVTVVESEVPANAGAEVEVKVKKARVVKGKKVPVTVLESEVPANVDAVVEVKKARAVKGKKAVEVVAAVAVVEVSAASAAEEEVVAAKCVKNVVVKFNVGDCVKYMKGVGVGDVLDGFVSYVIVYEDRVQYRLKLVGEEEEILAEEDEIYAKTLIMSGSPSVRPDVFLNGSRIEVERLEIDGTSFLLCDNNIAYLESSKQMVGKYEASTNTIRQLTEEEYREWFGVEADAEVDEDEDECPRLSIHF